MNAREQGFLLLTSHLGDPGRKVLTVAQMRVLTEAVRSADFAGQDRAMVEEDLMQLGYNRPSAQRILQLLSETDRLQWYTYKGAQAGCVPVTRVSAGYPLLLRKRLGLDSPGCLWAKGDLSLLEKPAIALVGSRDLRPENREFAREVGRQAALQGYVLVSGNARGADIAAQESCLESGGQVISIVADSLAKQTTRPNVLYLSEDGYDLPFSTPRALSRNRLIHCMGRLTLVAQCRKETGGSWSGSVNNLHHQWSPLFCFSDGSDGACALISRGAAPVSGCHLTDLEALRAESLNFFDL